MPGKVKVKILAGRNLPVMDRSSDTTDAYVEIKLSSITHKTDVCRKSLNPQWNSDWYRFEVDDAELQDEPLQIRLMDHDTYSANDAIGKVYISLNPLLQNSNTGKGSVMSGWIPVYDTMHGVRGEVNLIVKVDLFSDVNKFRQSSCGVQFFHSPNIPHGYHAQVIHGFVEELVVNDDPEYQWIDKIRTPRASNEARQVAFLKLSGQVQRKIGLKAIDLGANAVIGYNQCFDLEGDVGIVARGIGTAITLIKIHDYVTQSSADAVLMEERTLKYFEFLTGGNQSLSDSMFLDNNKSEESLYKIPDNVKVEIKPSKSKEKGLNLLLNKRKASKKDECVVNENKTFQSLLEQEDNRDTLMKNQFSWNIKNIKHSSKKLMNKKIASLTNKSGSSKGNPLHVEVKTRSETDISSHSSIFLGRNSLTDLRGKKKKFEFQRSTSDGSTMTALLVRTLMEASSPLDSITEHHDSPRSSPVNSERRFDELKNPLSDVQNPNRILASSISLKEEILLSSKLKGANSSESSLFRGESTCPNSSSSGDDEEDDDDDDEDEDDDYDLSGANTDIETVSMVIKKVLASESQTQQEQENVAIDNTLEATDTAEDLHKVPSQASLRIDELSKIIHTGSTRVTKTDHGYAAESHLTDSAMKPEAIEKYLAQSYEDNISDNWIQPGSTTADDPITEDKKSHTFLHGIQENISEKFHHLQDHFHHHHADEIRHHPKHPGLLETAMGAMLIDKLNIMEAQTGLACDDINIPAEVDEKPNESLLHDLKENISEKFHHLRDHMPHIHSSAHNLKDSISEKLHHIHLPHLPDSQILKDQIHNIQEHIHMPHLPGHSKGEIIHHSEPGLLETAMQTMLIDKLNILEVQSGIATIEGSTSGSQEIRRASADSVLSKKLSAEEINEESGSHVMRRKSLDSVEPDDLKGQNLFESVVPSASDKSNLLELPRKGKPTASPEDDTKKKENRRVSFEAIKKKLSFSLDNPLANRKQSKEDCGAYSAFNKKSSLTSTAEEWNIPAHLMNEDELTYSARDFMTTSYPSTTSKANVDDILFIVTPEIVIISSDQDTDLVNENETVSVANDINLCCTPPTPALDNPVILASKQKSNNNNNVLNNNNINNTDSNVCNLLTNKMLLHEFSNFSKLRSETSASPSGSKLGHARAESSGGVGISGGRLSQSPAKMGTPSSAIVYMGGKEFMNICRRSSDSDLSTIVPKGNSLTADRSTGFVRVPTSALMKPPLNQENLDMLEYPFLTISKFPPGFILHLGGTVAARSVKLLERVPNPDEPETRDSWWNELRMEIRSHARALGCNVVLGYTEGTTISDDVCVLSATGTAAIINLQYTGDIPYLDVSSKTQLSTNSKELMTSSLDRQEFENEGRDDGKQPTLAKSNESSSKSNDEEVEAENLIGKTPKEFVATPPAHQPQFGCSVCHIPYSQASVPYRVTMLKCAICKRGKVPDVLLATIEIPDGLQVTGRGCLLQAHVCRVKRDLKSESNAKEISDGLPFLEYELHRLLISKLKVKGMNAIFGLKATVAIGERMIALIATGTAVFLTALPPPLVPKIIAGNSWTDKEKLNEVQKSLYDTVERNREIYQLKTFQDFESKQLQPTDVDGDDSDDELTELDLTLGNKDTCVLEVDDIQDLEVISLLMEPCPPEGFHVVNTMSVPGLYDLEIVRNLQMFTQVWRAKLPLSHSNNSFSRHFQRLLQTIYFKLRTMIPCAICDLRFRLDLPESDEIQLLVTGMALGLGDPAKMNKFKRRIVHSSSKDGSNKIIDDELIFSLEEDQENEASSASGTATAAQSLNAPISTNGSGSLKSRKKSPPRSRVNSAKLPRHMPIRERYGVDITPLSYVPGGKIDKYLGNLNFFFIRESTSIRENGGISGFVHSFITELLAVVRAHITALGGNAMVSFYITELILVDNPHKNQGQCLVSVGGDVVFVSYYTDD